MVSLRRLMITEAERAGIGRLFYEKLACIRAQVASFIAKVMGEGRLRAGDADLATNQIRDLDGLFATVANQLSSEMSERIADGVRDLPDPACRLANGIRFFVRRAHEEPHWGQFICRCALSDASLQEIWTGQPATDLQEGLDSGRFGFQTEQLTSVIGMLAGGLGAIFLVLEGRRPSAKRGRMPLSFF